MAVNLSPIGGVAGQFFDNNGDPLSGGKIYTYAAGTTTPSPTFTSSGGGTPHSNPIILDAAGRVPSGEIWLTDGIQYKFIIKTSTDVQIGSYDNIIGINSNFVNYTNSQEIQTATAGQTVFTLTTMTYQPGTNSLSVFVDGVNQYGPGALYAYQETSSTVVTFTAGLHVGAEVKFTTSAINASSYGDAGQISYTPPFTGGVTTNVEVKLSETISVLDFGADPSGATDSSAALQAAFNAAAAASANLLINPGIYALGSTVTATGLADYTKITAHGATFKPLNSSVTRLIYINGLRGSVFTTTLAANAVRYDESVTVTSASNLSVGQILQFYSREWFDPDQTKRTYETNRIRAISGTTVYLDGPMLASFTAAGDISGGGDGTITIYVRNPTVGLVWEGGYFQLSATVQEGLYIQALSDAIITDVRITDAGFYGMDIGNTANLLLKNSCSYRHGRNIDPAGNYGAGDFGYGFIHTHCAFARVVDCSGGAGWHTFDASDGVRDITYYNCQAREDQYGLSSHQNCISVVYENCTVEGKNGCTQRARYVTFKNCTVQNKALQAIGCSRAVRDLTVDGCILTTTTAGNYALFVSVSGATQTVAQSFSITDTSISGPTSLALFGTNSTLLFQGNSVFDEVNLSSVGSVFVADCVFKNVPQVCLTTTGVTSYIQNNKFYGAITGSAESHPIQIAGTGDYHVDGNACFVPSLFRFIRATSGTPRVKSYTKNAIQTAQFNISTTGGATVIVDTSAFNMHIGGTSHSGAGVTITNSFQDYNSLT